MQASHQCSVSLLFTALDLPLWSSIDTIATLYQKDTEQFHLVLTEPVLAKPVLTEPMLAEPVCSEPELAVGRDSLPRSLPPTPRLLWLELSPYRVALTMQGNGQFSYRHLWQPGVYGLSRYWLHHDTTASQGELCLRNYTRRMELQGAPLPTSFRVEYELWAEQVQLGHYVVKLELGQPNEWRSHQ